MPGMPGLLNNIVSNVINKLKKKKNKWKRSCRIHFVMNI